ncbi:MAG: hypothetical protein P8Y70_19315 [Candidatus Lokiarchaeota archaeon]
MTESEYEYFMVYKLKDDGEGIRIDVSEEDLQSILDPEEVFVIVKEPIRRIFIWKGAKSPVRKRFISSRVASGLQEELVKEAAFHRCKIVSVDQGDEVTEFLKTFHLESMEVTDKLQDMRYVRNIEKDSSRIIGHVIEDIPDNEDEYYSPALEELKRKGVDIKSSLQKANLPNRSPTRKVHKREIIDKILKAEVPERYQRQNLILGKNLYGAVSKVTNVFGDDIEKTDWELVGSVPKGTFLLKDSLFRIYFDKMNHLVEAVEILKDKNSDSKMEKVSVKLPNNKDLLNEKILKIEVPENYRRINLIEGNKLYGATSKKVEVFGEEHEAMEWQQLEEIPKGIISLEDHIFRIYFNEEKDIIDAIEILQETKKRKMPVKSNENSTITQKTNKKRTLKQIPRE